MKSGASVLRIVKVTSVSLVRMRPSSTGAPSLVPVSASSWPSEPTST